MSETKKETNDADNEVTKKIVGEVINKSSKETTQIVKASPSSASRTTLPVEVPLTKDELATLDYSTYDTMARMLELGKVLAKSKLVPLNSPEDVATALMTGRELGLPFITSVTQIYPINNRPTLGVHIQKALLLKAGVIFEKIEDAIPIYNFIKAKDGKPVLRTVTKDGKEFQVPTILSIGIANKQPDGSLRKQIDTRTTYLFTREIKMPSGKFKEITAKGSFSLGEATEAELTDKDVWKKYWRRMLDARAFTNGARDIADDILLGIYSPNELSNDYYVNNAGEEVHTAHVIED